MATSFLESLEVRAKLYEVQEKDNARAARAIQESVARCPASGLETKQILFNYLKNKKEKLDNFFSAREQRNIFPRPSHGGTSQSTPLSAGSRARTSQTTPGKTSSSIPLHLPPATPTGRGRGTPAAKSRGRGTTARGGGRPRNTLISSEEKAILAQENAQMFNNVMARMKQECFVGLAYIDPANLQPPYPGTDDRGLDEDHVEELCHEVRFKNIHATPLVFSVVIIDRPDMIEDFCIKFNSLGGDKDALSSYLNEFLADRKNGMSSESSF